MTYKIFWLQSSKDKLKSNYEFILLNWNKKIANDFINKLNNKLRFLAHFPNLGQRSQKKKDVRRYVISEQVSLYYKIDKRKIIILTFFDNRQNPDKSKY